MALSEDAKRKLKLIAAREAAKANAKDGLAASKSEEGEAISEEGEAVEDYRCPECGHKGPESEFLG